jgi:CHAD domain-containing protein
MAKAKKIEGLDCGAGAVAGVRRVLLVRLGEMCGFREAALDWGDPEGVHDMRVASRRLRSAVRDFLPYLNRRGRFEEARDDLKRLADALGEVRDEDVALIELEKLKAEAPPEALGGLGLLVGEREARREEKRARLSGAITRDAVEEFGRLFQEAIEEATPKKRRRKKKGSEGDGGEGASASDDEGGTSFRAAGRAVILKLWDELAALSGSLYRPRKTKRLHKMRIAAKRLRYALELFAPCWEGATKAFAEEVAELQGALGELHDCDAWIKECGERLSEEGKAEGKGGKAGEDEDESGARLRAARVWLLGHFAEARAGHYRRALVLWHEWERADFAARLAACVEAD